tara:strand:+ start:140 stop:301 length:162 start_codon:yes stop_codon:yes gene_type:complete
MQNKLIIKKKIKFLLCNLIFFFKKNSIKNLRDNVITANSATPVPIIRKIGIKE